MQVETNARDLDSLLAQSVQDVLESMCFTMVDAAVDPPDEYPLPCVEVRLNFRGVREGEFWLLFPQQIAEEVGAAFSGGDDPCDQTAEEVVRELANIMCGSTLSHLGDDGLFDLDSPIACWITEPPIGPRLPHGHRVDYQIGGQVVSAAIAFRTAE